MTTQEEVEALGVEWQARLRLLDWDVDWQVKRYWDMSDGATVGTCDYNVELKHAFINILDDRDLTDRNKDLEETIVHELLHLHAAGFHNAEYGRLGGARKVAMEIMVDTLSRVLVRLKREGDLARLEGERDATDKAMKLMRKAK